MKRLLLSALAALIAQTTTASASNNCAPRDAVIAYLADEYDETRQIIGLDTGGALVEVFASLETGSWTITVTRPDGETCPIAWGQSFENLAEALPPEGDDT